MQTRCNWCNADLQPYEIYQVTQQVITKGLCSACARTIFTQDDSAALERFLDSIDSPVLLLQEEPRVVCSANKKACDVLGKELAEIKGKKSGDVFACLNSFSSAGCGKSKPCATCTINNSLSETFNQGTSFEYVVTLLDIKKHHTVATYKVQLAMEKAGTHALMRIDQFVKSEKPGRP